MKHKLLFIILIFLIPIGTFSQEFCTLSGKITDSQTGKELDGIDIVVENKTTGTISNYKGLYSLYLNQGSYKITYSGKGYSVEELTVNLNSDQVQMIELSHKQEKTKRKGLKIKQHKQTEILSANTE